MPGIFDNFNASQANNGQAPPSPQTTFGAPGFPSGSWGNQPPNMAGGLQQFLASRGMAQPQPGGMQTNGPMPGQLGAPTTASQVNSASQGPQGLAPIMQNATQNGGMAVQNGGGASLNFAGGMQPFIGARQ